MKLSISNIAWPATDENHIFDCIKRAGYDAIEIAPSRIWKDFRGSRENDRKTYLREVLKCDLHICAMHSLFWDSKQLSIFGNAETIKETKRYFIDLLELAHDLEIPYLIMGSPAVRRCEGKQEREAVDEAVAFFHPVAERARELGTKILIEPLSREETDFIITHEDGISLVAAVNSKGFGLHLDAKAISAQEESLRCIIEGAGSLIEHFHVNEIGLGSFKNAVLNHREMSRYLKEIQYKGFVSIEMKTLPDYQEEIRYAMKFVREIYGDETNTDNRCKQ